VKFFLDNCLSPRYAKSLDILSEKDGHEPRKDYMLEGL